MQPVVTSPPSKKKGKYDITFKLKVIQWAEKHSNRAAGSKFGLNESTIRGWRKSAVANSLEALGADFSRGVLSLHQPLHDAGHLNGHVHPAAATAGGLGGAAMAGPTAAAAAAAAAARAKLHDPLREGRRPLSRASAHLPGSRSVSGAESGGESPPPPSLNMDERELARLSCSPSDDGYYEDVGYQEEVVDDDMSDGQHAPQHFAAAAAASAAAAAQHLQHPQQHPQHHQHQHGQKLQHQLHYASSSLPVASSPSPAPTPSPPPPLPILPSKPLLKTISHQVTSKPFPEIQLPFTVIVCKSVRDHWLQRYASQLPVRPVTEQDSFAMQLGLERR